MLELSRQDCIHLHADLIQTFYVVDFVCHPFWSRRSNDPNFVVQFAIGEPLPNLIAQSKDSGIRMSGVYFDTTKRYIMKHAHMSKEDVSTHHFIF